jgi:hypothetical protein
VDIFNIKSTRASFQVNLKNNALKTMPEGIFDMAIKSSGTVKVYLQNNNWRCDCDLAWLRNYMDKKIINVKDKPICISPEINKDKSLKEADFSDCNTTTLPSASSTATTEAITSSTTETATSEYNTPSTVDTTVDSTTSTTETSDPTKLSTEDDTTTIPTQGTDDTIISSSEVTTDTTTSSTQDNVSTTTSPTQVTTDTTSSSTGDTYYTITASTELTSIKSPTDLTNVNCSCPTCGGGFMHISTETNREASSRGINNIIDIAEDEQLNQINVSIEDHNNHILIWMTRNHIDGIDCNFKDCSTGKAQFSSEPNTAYMICAAEWVSENEITISTLNCRAYTTLPSPPYRAWLQNKDRDTLLFILCAALLVSVIAGAATIYCVLLDKPELINGNKRVIVVNCRTNQVIMIMPKGYGENDSRRTSYTSYNTVSRVRPVM